MTDTENKEFEQNTTSPTPEYPECAADIPVTPEMPTKKRIPPQRNNNDNELPIAAVYAGPMPPPVNELPPIVPATMLVYAGPGMMNCGMSPFAPNPNIPRVPEDSQDTPEAVFCPACGA